MIKLEERGFDNNLGIISFSSDEPPGVQNGGSQPSSDERKYLIRVLFADKACYATLGY